MAKKKITSITQIPGEGEQNARPAAGHIRPTFKLGSKQPFPFTRNMNSTNPMARYVQDAIKQIKPKSKTMSPLDQLKRG